MRSVSLAVLLAFCVASPALADARLTLSSKYLFAQPDASAPAPLAYRKPFDKPSPAELAARQHHGRAVLKFTDGTAVRLRGEELVVTDSELELDRAARHGVTRSKLDLQLAEVKEILMRSKALVGRLFSVAENLLREQRRTGEANTARELPDLNLFFDLHFPNDTSPDVIAILHLLNQFDIVEFTAPALKPAPPPEDIPPTTGNLTAHQGYFAAAPTGIDVNYARVLPGGRGEGIRVVDVETGWTPDHEDLPAFVSTSGMNYPDTETEVPPARRGYHRRGRRYGKHLRYDGNRARCRDFDGFTGSAAGWGLQPCRWRPACGESGALRRHCPYRATAPI